MRGSQRWHPWLLVAVAACSPETNELRDLSQSLQPAKTGGDSPTDGSSTDASGDAGSGGDGTARTNEVCDGFDNDGDGEIDEELVGGGCVDSLGRPGAERCVRGEWTCRACEPGDQRPVDCPCGPDRTETCGPDGYWQTELCDGCADTQPTGCATAEACTPGDLQVRRCDACGGEACGTDCIGAEWRCNATCTWEQVSACRIYEEPQCSQDGPSERACGRCGTQRRWCDGCFWVGEPCLPVGECNPGETRQVPCGDDGTCTPGFAQTMVCNSRCRWEARSGCVGCDVGASETTSVACVVGADCGERIDVTTCTGTVVRTCDDTDIVVGHETSEVVQTCTAECAPGATSSVSDCTTAAGECGYQEMTCSPSCMWEVTSDCSARPDGCVPDSIETEAVSCNNSCDPGASYTIERTCLANGCGWSSVTIGSCPCVPDRTSSQNCQMGDGRCGTQIRTCLETTCDWSAWGACTPRSWSCVPGTTRDETLSCGLNTCGRTYTRASTCRADGCGWTLTGNDSATACPPCRAGQSYAAGCTPDGGVCGSTQVYCDERTCEWVQGECQLSDNSCTPGDTRTEPCQGVCGLSGSQTFACRTNGCGWLPNGGCQLDTPPECTPPAVEREDCPGCETAVHERTCQEDCLWSRWTDCPPCG